MMEWQKHTEERLEGGKYWVTHEDGSRHALRHYTGPHAHRIGSLALHMADLRQAKECLRFVVESVAKQPPDEPWTDIQRGLYESALMTYSRCFDKTGGARDRLDEKDIYRNLPAGAQNTHKHIWDARRTHYAHDVSGLRDAAVGLALRDRVCSVHVPIISADPGDDLVRDFGVLIDEALKSCIQENKELQQQVAVQVAKRGIKEAETMPFLTLKHALNDPHARRTGTGHKPFRSKS